MNSAMNHPDVEATIAWAFSKAITAHQAGALQVAEPLYREVLVLDPNHVNTLSNLSSLYLIEGDYENAVVLIGRALVLAPHIAALHYNYGKILMHVKMREEALVSYNQAIALEPNNAVFYSNRGVTLFELNRYEEAIESYNRAIALDPTSAEYYNNRGNALGHVKRIADASSDYAKAIALAPEMADAYWNQAILQIMQGNFAEGFKNYEWRWKKASFAGDLRPLEKPLWLGDAPLESRTILIYPEQGLGDSIQFCRYIPSLEAMGAQVILEVPKPLVGLLETVSTTTTVIAKQTPAPPYDYQCPMLSLPLAFGTTVETIPNRVPYLSVGQEARQRWQQRLGPKTKPRIGLVWSGSPTHVNDHNRSIPLALLAPLQALPYEFHALQKDLRASDLPHAGWLQLHHQALTDFTDTAALVEAMDLVISVDTSVAHVAGALAKPLWLLLPYIPDYRWLLDRDDTPWYPTAKLWRQPQPGDWATILLQLSTTLSANPLRF